MKYQVIWQAVAEEELASIWLAAPIATLFRWLRHGLTHACPVVHSLWANRETRRFIALLIGRRLASNSRLSKTING